jgi:hypothetical protein
MNVVTISNVGTEEARTGHRRTATFADMSGVMRHL